MAHNIGRQEQVGIGIEATAGTAVSPVFWLPVLEKDVEDRAEVVLDESGTGTAAEHSDAKILKQWSDGSIRMNVYQNSIGALLTLINGASPSTVLSSGEYTHTYELANTVTPKTATLAFKDSNSDLANTGSVLDSATFTLETGSFFNVETQFMGKKSEADSNTPSRTAENIFIPTYAGIKLATAQSGLTAASTIAVKSANFTIAKNAVDKQNLGSVDIASVLSQQVSVTGTLEIYYDGNTYKDFVFNQTERALRIGLTNTAATLANSSNPRLFFDFYRVRFSDWERQKGNNDIIMETVNFTALIDYANSQKLWRFELLNGIAGTSY